MLLIGGDYLYDDQIVRIIRELRPGFVEVRARVGGELIPVMCSELEPL